MVSVAFRVTETVGNCTIQRDEYAVSEDAGGEDDSEKDAACMMASTMWRVWRERHNEYNVDGDSGEDGGGE
jgi:hypothetical protein